MACTQKTASITVQHFHRVHTASGVWNADLDRSDSDNLNGGANAGGATLDGSDSDSGSDLEANDGHRNSIPSSSQESRKRKRKRAISLDKKRRKIAIFLPLIARGGAPVSSLCKCHPEVDGAQKPIHEIQNEHLYSLACIQSIHDGKTKFCFGIPSEIHGLRGRGGNHAMERNLIVGDFNWSKQDFFSSECPLPPSPPNPQSRIWSEACRNALLGMAGDNFGIKKEQRFILLSSFCISVSKEAGLDWSLQQTNALLAPDDNLRVKPRYTLEHVAFFHLLFVCPLFRVFQRAGMGDLREFGHRMVSAIGLQFKFWHCLANQLAEAKNWEALREHITKCRELHKVWCPSGASPLLPKILRTALVGSTHLLLQPAEAHIDFILEHGHCIVATSCVGDKDVLKDVAKFLPTPLNPTEVLVVLNHLQASQKGIVGNLAEDGNVSITFQSLPALNLDDNTLLVERAKLAEIHGKGPTWWPVKVISGLVVMNSSLSNKSTRAKTWKEGKPLSGFEVRDMCHQQMELTPDARLIASQLGEIVLHCIEHDPHHPNVQFIPIGTVGEFGHVLVLMMAEHATLKEGGQLRANLANTAVGFDFHSYLRLPYCELMFPLNPTSKKNYSSSLALPEDQATPHSPLHAVQKCNFTVCLYSMIATMI